MWKLEPGEEDTFGRYFDRVEGGWPASQQPRESGHHLGPCDEVRRLFFAYELCWIDRICIDLGNEEGCGKLRLKMWNWCTVLVRDHLQAINSRIGTEKDLNLLAEHMAGCFVNRNNNLGMLSQAGKALELWLNG